MNKHPLLAENESKRQYLFKLAETLDREWMGDE
jgi:hypothetical protein